MRSQAVFECDETRSDAGVMRFEALIHTPPQTDSRIADMVLRKSRHGVFAARYLRAQRTPSVSCMPIEHQGRRQKTRVSQDAELKLAHANRLATLGHLAASISHEIRQPVASAIFNAQAAEHWLAASPPNLDEARASLARVVTSGKRADEVIGRIRALVRQAPVRREPVSINDAIHEVMTLVHGEAAEHRVSICPDLGRDLPSVQGDRIQLQQVIMNLMINAVEAMSHSVATVRVLTIATRGFGKSAVRVSISDTGPGVSGSDVSRVFEAFYTTKPAGMGMGLSICRSIVQAHGGTLRILANEPHGATFQFDLSAVVEEAR